MKVYKVAYYDIPKRDGYWVIISGRSEAHAKSKVTRMGDNIVVYVEEE